MRDTQSLVANVDDRGGTSPKHVLRLLWQRIRSYSRPTGWPYSLLELAAAVLIAALMILSNTHSLVGNNNDFRQIAWDPANQLRLRGMIDLHYPYPLWTPLLMFPWTFGSLTTGGTWWFIFNLVLLAYTIIGITRLFRWSAHPLVLQLAVSLAAKYVPVQTSLWFGQLMIVELALLIGICFALQRARWTTLGFLLGATLIKPQLLFVPTVGLLVWALWHRRWQVPLAFGSVFAGLVALAAPFAVTPRQILGGGIGEHLQLYVARGSTIWGLGLTLFPHDVFVPALISAGLLVWLAYLWIPALTTEVPFDRMLFLVGIACVVNILVTPYGWSYNNAILILPVCYVLDRCRRLGWPARGIWMAAVFLLLFPGVTYIYNTLTEVYRNEAFQVIPVVLFLPILIVAEVHCGALRSRSTHTSPGGTLVA